MIFGENHHTVWKKEQERLKALYSTKELRFAWLPVRMDDGVWVWLEKYEYDHRGYIYHKYGVYTETSSGACKRAIRSV